MDIDAIGPGVDYARLIDETIDTVEAVIVVIGQQWLSAADADGRRRLDDPEDLVRQEISVALARDVLVIPVLVQDAVLPGTAAGPAPLNSSALPAATRPRRAMRVGITTRIALSQSLEESLDPTAPTGAVPVIDPRIDEETSVTWAAKPSSTPMILAVTGALLVLLFGIFVGPTWHDEQVWLRIVVAPRRGGDHCSRSQRPERWSRVMIAGGVGLGGFVIWVLMLIGVHELSEH